MRRDTLFLAALFFTVFCTAVNAYTWRIAYPLWRSAGAGFAATHASYMRRLTPVITVPHIGMFFTAGALLVYRPIWFNLSAAVVVFALETVVIGVSIAVAGPVHSRFTRQGVTDEHGLTRLIHVSLLRTVLMLLASAMLFWRLLGALHALRQLSSVMM